jgi:hypothetical protein
MPRPMVAMGRGGAEVRRFPSASLLRRCAELGRGSSRKPDARGLLAQYQLGFLGSGGYTGTTGTKPSRFGISTFGRVLASRTSLSWMMPF